MSTQTLPRSAELYGVAQRQEIAAALTAVQRLWGRMGPDFDLSYAQIEPRLWRVMDLAQERVSAGAAAYVPDVMREMGVPNASDPEYAVSTSALVGTSGDGLGTDSLAYGSVIHAKTAIKDGLTPVEALARGGQFLTTAVGTMLSDTGRTVERMASESRGVTVYVRMLEPPSCGRCVILAGRRTTRQQAFLRHPKCDCRNIPASEAIADDITVSPGAYLDELSDEDLARTLGSKANAQAYLDGADENQLINAYRRGGDVREAQQYGHTIKYTTEGVTRRGRAYRSMSQMRANQGLDARGRNIVRTPRLMPESIYQIAKDRADAQRLLRTYGWIT